MRAKPNTVHLTRILSHGLHGFIGFQSVESVQSVAKILRPASFDIRSIRLRRGSSCDVALVVVRDMVRIAAEDLQVVKSKIREHHCGDA